MAPAVGMQRSRLNALAALSLLRSTWLPSDFLSLDAGLILRCDFKCLLLLLV